MAHFKLKLSVLIFVVAVFQLQGQKNPVLYGGMELFRHTGFENNTFGNFSLGSQLYHWKFFAPEIGYSHYTGTLEERSIYKEPGISARGIFERKFNTNVFTVTPKIKVGKDDAFLSFSPNYHIGMVNATGNYFVVDGGRYVLKEGQKTSTPVHFWSFSLGVEGLAILEDKYWFTLFLTYTEVDANAALSKLDLTEYEINTFGITTTSIGFGIRFYYNPFPVKDY